MRELNTLLFRNVREFADMGVSLRFSLCLGGRLSENQRRSSLRLPRLLHREWLRLVADPALDGFIVGAKLDTDHSLVAPALEFVI